MRSQNLQLQRLEAEARRCLLEAGLARQLGRQRRQQQQEEPVQAEPEGVQEQQHHLAKTKMEELGLRSIYVLG